MEYKVYGTIGKDYKIVDVVDTCRDNAKYKAKDLYKGFEPCECVSAEWEQLFNKYHFLWHRLNEELQTFNYRPNPAYHLFLRTPRTKNGFWFCFVFLIFIYLFGCIGSQLWHMGSSLHYAGYFVVAHGIFFALCGVFC